MIDLPSFDELMRMAKEDPLKLEELRSMMINELINRQKDENIKTRLIGLQQKINRIHNSKEPPLQSCIKIIKLMDESLVEMNYVFKYGHRKEKKESAKIIKFPG